MHQGLKIPEDTGAGKMAAENPGLNPSTHLAANSGL